MLNRHLREMTSAIVVVLWLNILIGIRVFGIENGVTCGRGLVMHTNNAGLNRCCLNIACDPGTEARPCEDLRPDSTSCIRCGSGKFQSERTESYLLRKCQRHTSCNSDTVVSRPGSATTDVKCTCNLALCYHGTAPDCLSDYRCGPGNQLTLSGTCEQCPPNTYRNNSSLSLCVCRPCSSCDLETQEIANSCTAVSDTICSNRTLDHNPDKVSNLSMKDLLLLIILGVFVSVTVVVVLTVIMVRLRKRRNGETSLSKVSFSSGSNSNSDPNSEQCPVINQSDAHGLLLEVKENLDEQCRGSNGDTPRETEALIDYRFRRCSLCDFETVQRNQKFDFDQPWKSDSKGIVNSPSDDLSILDVNLMDDRDQQSVQYVVETESLPSCSHGATVLRGKCNVQNGNVYVFEHCNNVKIVPK